MGQENHKTILTLILLPVKIGVAYKLRSNDLFAKFADIPEEEVRILERRRKVWDALASSCSAFVTFSQKNTEPSWLFKS